MSSIFGRFTIVSALMGDVTSDMESLKSVKLRSMLPSVEVLGQYNLQYEGSTNILISQR
mgnify:CR=1 FL=1